MAQQAARPAGPNFGRVLTAIRQSMGGSLPFVVGFTGFAGYTLYKSVYFVPSGNRAVKFNCLTGLHPTSFGEGANLAIPYVETPILMDVRNRALEIASSSGSRDLQLIDMSVRVLFKPNVEQLHVIYRDLGVGYADTVLPALINEVVKAVIAQFNASELLVKRSEVSNNIALLLRNRARRFHLDISDVSITQMTFGREYTAAVEAKQIAQQMAERAKFQVDQAIQEKKGAILLAEGEAKAASLIGDAVNDNPGFLELRRLEATRAIAKAVAHGKGMFYLDASTLSLNSVEPDMASMTAGGYGSGGGGAAVSPSPVVVPGGDGKKKGWF